MSVYTRPNPAEDPFLTSSSPGLIFQKWQAWDGENNQFKLVNGKLVRTDSRLPYLQEIAGAVQKVYQNNYPAWRDRYVAALKTLDVDISAQYKTVWRLLVGWGSNPTLEAGMTLHHLYGFPYIPGSAVKGLLHHVAEMEVMKHWPSTISPENLDVVMQKLRLIKTLFGSIHLEKGLNKKTKEKDLGPDCPKPFLEEISKQWKPFDDRRKQAAREIDELLNEPTGGMLCFYDAVPATGQAELLQTDIVNCHYNEYYSDEGATPPSDDQNPNPVTFLAVKPGTEFTFPFRLAAWPAEAGRDKAEEQRWQVLQTSTPSSVNDQVKTWLQKALGEYGLGAKTAAGYGYFDTGVIAPPAAANPDKVVPPIVIVPETPIIPVEPAPFKSNVNPSSKINGIGKNHNQTLWQQLAANDHILKIDGKTPGLKAFGRSLPGREISPTGAAMQVFYQNEKFYCAVELKLQGIKNLSAAEHLWLNVILPELKKG